MKQPSVTVTITWIRHAPKYDLHTATRFWHLPVAILMAVTRIRLALDLDLTTITRFSMTLSSVSMTVTRIDQYFEDHVHTATNWWSIRPAIMIVATGIRVGTHMMQ